MTIQFQQMNAEDISHDFLRGYIRHEVTNEVYYMKNNQLERKPVYFEEDWDQKKLQSMSQYLHRVAQSGGIVIAGFDRSQVIAFGSVDGKEYFDTYTVMTYCHVSKPYRNQGLGKRLFSEFEKEVKKRGIQKLYISTHPSVQSQGFYRSVGCVLAKRLIPEMVELEPLDIQLEKVL